MAVVTRGQEAPIWSFPLVNFEHRAAPLDHSCSSCSRPFCIGCPKDSGCHCGESPDAQFEWEFSAEDKTRSTIVVQEERKIQFHPSYRYSGDPHYELVRYSEHGLVSDRPMVGQSNQNTNT